MHFLPKAGISLHKIFMSILTYRVTQLPDLEKTEYHAQYGDDPASRLFKMQDNFLYTLHTIANQYPLTCSLVMLIIPMS